MEQSIKTLSFKKSDRVFVLEGTLKGKRTIGLNQYQSDKGRK
jgi:ribosomal protein L24